MKCDDELFPAISSSSSTEIMYENYISQNFRIRPFLSSVFFDS